MQGQGVDQNETLAMEYLLKSAELVSNYDGKGIVTNIVFLFMGIKYVQLSLKSRDL